MKLSDFIKHHKLELTVSLHEKEIYNRVCYEIVNNRLGYFVRVCESNDAAKYQLVKWLNDTATQTALLGSSENINIEVDD